MHLLQLCLLQSALALLTEAIPSPKIENTTSPSRTTIQKRQDDQPEPPPANIFRTAIHPRLYGCSNSQKDRLNKLWKEAGDVARAHTLWAGGKTPFQQAMDLYMGTDSAKEGDPFFSTGPLKQDVKRQYGIFRHSQSWSPYWAYANFYCTESIVPHKSFTPPRLCEDGLAMYSFNDYGSKLGWDTHYLVFCEDFFSMKPSTDLTDKIASYKADPERAVFIDPFWRTSACAMLQTTYSWKGVLKPGEVSIPADFTPLEQVRAASHFNTEWVRRSVVNWATAATSIYTMQQLNLDSVPKPQPSPDPNPPDTIMTAPSANGTVDTKGAFNLILEQLPGWFEPPPAPLQNETSRGPDVAGSESLDFVSADEEDKEAFGVPGGGEGGDGDGEGKEVVGTS